MKKIILDVDTGIDDALALTYLLGNAVEVLGITTTFGNVTLSEATRNTLNLLALLNRPEIPVYCGAQHPLNRQAYQVPNNYYKIHGANGLGNVSLPAAQKNPEAMSAADFILTTAEKYGSELTLITLGPLTNLATAAEKNLTTVKKIGEIVSMAGALTLPGNVTPFAEANVYNDPTAAKFVFEELSLTMVGLDVTLKTMITEKEIAPWKIHNQAASQALLAFTEYYYQHEYGDAKIGGALHDPLAVAIALNKNFVKKALALNLTVETQGISSGRTIGSLVSLQEANKKTIVCLEIAAEEFVKDFSQTIQNLLFDLN